MRVSLTFLALVLGMATAFVPAPGTARRTRTKVYNVGAGGMNDTRDPEPFMNESDPRQSISRAPTFEEYLKKQSGGGGSPAPAPSSPPPQQQQQSAWGQPQQSSPPPQQQQQSWGQPQQQQQQSQQPAWGSQPSPSPAPAPAPQQKTGGGGAPAFNDYLSGL